MNSILKHFITQIRESAGKEPVSGIPEINQAIALDSAGGSAESCYPVSDFSQAAIAAAVHEVIELRRTVWASESHAQVHRMLASRWCLHSFYPLGWERPAIWDEFAGDYQTRDGWIRLHTNAPHHREAALGVLGQPATRQTAVQRVASWRSEELESAVVAARGAAAVMKTLTEWQNHVQGQALTSSPP